MGDREMQNAEAEQGDARADDAAGSSPGDGGGTPASPGSARGITRGDILRVGGMALALAAAGKLLGLVNWPSAAPPVHIRLGIVQGTQTMWRYMSARRDELLWPLGYDVEFTGYDDENTLRQAYVAGRLDAIATLVPALASFAEEGPDSRFFLPIAWMREGYPFVVKTTSTIQTVRDLIGRPIATYPLTHPGAAYWRALFLENYGVTLESLRPVQTLDPDALLDAGKVEAAALGAFQWADLSRKGGYRKVGDLRTEWEKASGSSRLLMFAGYLARPQFVQDQKRFVDDFIRLNFEGLRRYKSDKRGVLDVVAASQPALPMTLEQHEYTAWYLGQDDVEPERAYIRSEDVADHERLFGMLLRCGYLNNQPQRVADLFYVT